MLLSAFAAAAPSASATTVKIGDAFPGDPVNPMVVATDETGEVNNLTISYTYETNDEQFPPPGDGTVIVEDSSAPLEAGEGCQELGGNRVRCSVEGIVAIRALLGGAADTATAQSPGEGELSCHCVALFGGDGDDALTSFDGVAMHGEAGNDTLTGLTSTASGVPGGLTSASDDGLFGGPGNDMLDGGQGRDSLQGGAGDDVLSGGNGDDFMLGGETPSSFGGEMTPAGRPSPPAGSDKLDGGDGDDSLSDGDHYGPEIGPDELVAGAGVDVLSSYSGRERGVRVDLAKRGGNGEQGEDDTVVNFEIVYGSAGDDTLAGDGDGNQLHGFGGANTLRGRGGDDQLNALSLRRNRMFGDRGDDIITSPSWTPGSIDCGRGGDRIVQPPRGQDSPRQPRPSDPGIYVSASCEAIGKGLGAAWAVDPVPDRPVRNRTVTLDRAPGASFRKHSVEVTTAERPFRTLDRVTPTRRGVRAKLPGRVARRARRRGMTMRVEVYSEIFSTGQLKMLWRFRVPRAR